MARSRAPASAPYIGCMRGRPVLIFVVILTLAVEGMLMVLVRREVGDEHMMSQLARFLVQVAIAMPIILRKSKLAVLLLAVYHLLTGGITLTSSGQPETIRYAFAAYHAILAIIIYFHGVIERRFFGVVADDPGEFR